MAPIPVFQFGARILFVGSPSLNDNLDQAGKAFVDAHHSFAVFAVTEE
jgi:hypothetical protein